METDEILELLNRARAEELACVRLYSQNATQLEEIGNLYISRLFHEQMGEELLHARWLAARIRALGGIPTQEPASWCRKRGTRCGTTKIRRMLQEAAALERRELALYEQAILNCSMGEDIETKALLEQIVDTESAHEGQWTRLLAFRD